MAGNEQGLERPGNTPGGRLTIAQFFVYRQAIAWTLLVATLAWGVYAYSAMPQRQDPLIQIRSGVVLTAYPGASALEVEQELTRKVEKKLAENPAVEHVRSISRQGLSVVFVDLYDTTKDAEEVWHDLDGKLAAMPDLPSSGGAPVRPRLDKDFGDTVAVMLTLSSPPVPDSEIDRHAEVVARRLAEVRARADRGRLSGEPAPTTAARRASVVLVHPSGLDPALVERLGRSFLRDLAERKVADDGQFVGLRGAGAIDVRLAPGVDRRRLEEELTSWKAETLAAGLGHPDIWPPVVVESLDDLAAELRRAVRDEPGGVARYSYEQLHRFADRIQDRLRQSPRVGKVEQLGVVDEAIYLYLSGRRLGASGLDMQAIGRLLAARNLDVPGGEVQLNRGSLVVKPTGKLLGQADLEDIVVDGKDGYPIYLRDLAEIVRGYEDPPRMLHFRTVKEEARAEIGKAADTAGPHPLTTTRAVTLAVRHVKGTHIADFSRDVESALQSLKGVLPGDLRVERTSDEAERVERKIHEFDDCLIEAVAIVVVVALLFMEWRSALLVALSIPITLAMTLGACAAMGIDLQQVSIAALIIALGLLVDDPVVAGDAINREMAHGAPRDVAAWLGPQKLARAILYATITNCVAFLPLLLVTGVTGEFIYSLPIVVTASLVASRIVSMTFVPMLGRILLRGQLGLEAGLAEGGRGSRFARLYNGFSEVCMEYKWTSLAVCLIALAAGASLISLIGSSFFPKDLHNVFTVDLFLTEGTPIRRTKDEAMRAIAEIDALVGEEVEGYTTFVGAGGPRFWLSAVPEQPAPRYAQIMVHARDRHRTGAVAERLRRELPPRISSARVRVNQLETGPPIGIPVQVRLTGPDVATIRRLGEQVKDLLREHPGVTDIQDDWDPEIFRLGLKIDPDRANAAGVTNEVAANVVHGAVSGSTATTIRDRDRMIPVVLRLRPDERSRLSDLSTLGVPAAEGSRVPLDQIASFRAEAAAPKIARRDHERCLTVKCDAAPGVLPSRIVEFLEKRFAEVTPAWPPGYRVAFGGEKEEQAKGFASVRTAMIVSILAIYVALVMQFNSVTKPLVVFAAVPFGMVGGLMGLLLFDVPLGFMALLGLSSLAGVVISHVIVLFEYIEEAHERGEPLRRAVIDAALVRLRPVLVTVLATVGGLIPLVIRGGPLWEPLCYVQIVGLLLATLVTKVVVPVLYVLFVEDFHLIPWEEKAADEEPASVPKPAAPARREPATGRV
ncbi:Cobalt-zinc-cadmium resistance protein CzcA [Aquisphaera giovannonii]|uniref:Cobalt-zinc-cadmium resistance protein CzcA n=1 Tax=Aquisphaera giovannonii TaxID=406548 RepID=A0A5B9VXN0_9BACT|nr:efflux RND transporter permease subunit [Aquisphaera giovannonii]QEH32535.1 Cobalt-zinc-cadmium resistance protein CzcA [Aquisphaera giovannonii]